MELSRVFAEKFIEKIEKHSDYNVNIMDGKGIIIASKDTKRIGVFHEIAYRIIQGEEDTIFVKEGEKFLGVRPGVCMAINYNNSKIGVIGITGVSETVNTVALVAKMAIETMLEYEWYKEETNRRKSEKETFINLLLYGELKDKKSLKASAELLEYREDIIRIPILIEINGQETADNLLLKLRESTSHSSQDISFDINDKQILFFKCIWDHKEDLYSAYKFILGDSISGFLNYIRNRGIHCNFYIGSFQNVFENYKEGYKHCMWLRNYKIRGSFNDNLGVYFYDHIGEYLLSILPIMELHGIFNVFHNVLDTDFKEGFVETIDILNKHNYNLVESSRDLYVHKNTLIFRFNKIRELLGVNPMQKANERELLKYLSFYFKFGKK